MNLIKNAKNLLMTMVLVGTSLTLTSCTDQEVSDTITIIGAAVIIGAAIDHAPRDDHRRDYDRGHRGYCDSRYSDCRRRHFSSNSLLSSTSAQFETDNTVEFVQAANQKSDAERVSENYQISVIAAEKILNALDKAKSKDFSGVDDIGIARTDLNALYENQALTQYSYINTASALGLTIDDTKIFLSKVQANIQLARRSLAK